MTPAIKLLRQRGIAYTINEYQTDGGNRHFGDKAVTALGQDPHQVFKTLLAVVDGDQHKPVVALVPVADQLDTRKLATTMSAKRADMAEPELAQRRTGYLIGGISPVAQKQLFTTIIDETAQLFDQIFISAGRRGLQLALAPHDLAHICKASFADISRSTERNR